MLKVINAAESIAESNYQTALLLHAAQQAPVLQVPRVILTRCQLAEPVVDIGGNALRIRLVNFLEGTPLHAVTPSLALMVSLGHTLAQLDVAFSSFSHPAQQRQLLWDISRAEQIWPYLAFVENAEQQAAITQILQRYDSHRYTAAKNTAPADHPQRYESSQRADRYRGCYARERHYRF